MTDVTRRSVIDLGLAGATGFAVTITMLVAAAPAGPTAQFGAVLLGALLGGVLLLRRRWPVGVLVASLVIVLLYYLTDLPGVSPIWLLLVPLYTVARAGQMLLAALVGSSVLLLAVGWLVGTGSLELAVLDGAVSDTVLLALALALASAVRHRQRWITESQARRLAEQEQRERAHQQKLLAERLAIARELHDVTAHALAVVGVQVNLADELVTEDPAAARQVLAGTRLLNQEAIGELAAAVRVLRGGAEPPTALAPPPGVAGLPALLERVAASGLATELQQAGPARELPPGLGLTLYRIAQESLTNVLRHANADSVVVELRYEPAGVRLTVADDGAARAGPLPTGHGLTGMRERAGAMGGWFSAGPGEAGGFTVQAWLPWQATPAGEETSRDGDPGPDRR